MADCRFCNTPAGFFKKQHPECEFKHTRALALLESSAQSAARGAIGSSELNDAAVEARANYVTDSEVRLAIVRGWEEAVEHFLMDDLLEPEEETRLVRFQTEWSLDQSELDARGAYSKIVKSAALRDIMEGKIPQRVMVDGLLPFNFQKGEQLVWVFPQTEYLEDKIRREYVGRTAGVSVRIARGVYYRTGGFRGTPIERTERVSLGRGLLGVTTKHIYFAGAKSFRVRHDKIVTYTPFSDGVGIVKDSASAKPQIFVTGDGWFTYNLLTNVGQL